MSAPKHLSDWERLFRIACALIHQVNSKQSIIDHWTLGGGTAMMLQIGHRESHDVDIFLPDPQLLAFLDPQKHDFKFDIWPTDQDGDGAGFLKLAFKDIGEIDFIVGRSMTSSPTMQQVIERESVELETIPEIIVKKSIIGDRAKDHAIFSISLQRARAMETRSLKRCTPTGTR